MQGKIKYFVMFALMCVVCFNSRDEVFGYTGSGTKSKPYVVKTEADFREILTSKGGDSWKYIAVNGNITIRKSIVISKGKFRIYAKGAGRTIKRSAEATDTVNSGESPKFCILVNGSANVVFGYKDGSSQQLKLGGNKSNFTGKKKSSGFVYVGSKAIVKIDENALLTNVKNNKSDEGGTAIYCEGSLTINGEISNCDGTDGGAVGIKNGTLSIGSTAYIHHCTSETEGGGIFGIKGCSIEMNGGTISSCTAKEEGGGVFVGGESKCKITAGNITGNLSGLSGGGFFSGMGAEIVIGKTDGTGPVISYNKAETIGGGIRCNGGKDTERGGTSYFYGGSVTNNTAGETIGGISCGSKGSRYNSMLYVKKMQILNNSAGENVGGIRIPSGVIGTSTKEVYLIDCLVQGNKASGYSGGLMLEGTAIVENSSFVGNYGKKNGGGIYINGGTLQLNSSYVKNNTSEGKGAGIYVDGFFQIRNSTYIQDNNEVYLTKGKYIDVIGKLSKASGLIAKINSQVNTNGTKLVKAGYSGGTARGELYYSDANKSERYSCISMSKTQLLRPSENVNGYEKVWIIISEKYKIQYNKNTDDDVTNMPENQDKYWNENITLSQKKIERNGYILEENKHWNIAADGSGKIHAPGTLYTDNGNATLYAMWKQIVIKEIYINTTDRYYVINQKITLNCNELLKKVTTDDDLHTGIQYEVRVTKIDRNDHSNIVNGNNLVTENYMNTSEVSQYTLTVEAEDEISKVKASGTMHVYVLNTDLSNGQVRFISNKYIDTLDIMSKWNKSLKNQLTESLNNSGGGMYCIHITKTDINQIKKNIKNNNYIINNTMNKNVVGKLDI